MIKIKSPNSSATPKSLNSKMLQALPLIVSGQSLADVAKAVNCSPGTVRNWCSGNASFKAELALLRQLLYAEATESLRSLSACAVHALAKVINDPSAMNKDVISAARVVLSHTHSVRNVVSIENDDSLVGSIAAIFKKWDQQNHENHK